MRIHALLACIVLTNIAVAQDRTKSHAPTAPLLDQYRETAIERWESDIRALEAKDKSESYPADAVLFIGSSSIRRWSTIKEDVAPYAPIQRGYGGARFSDEAVFAKRLIHPHRYRALVMFVANDIRGKPDDHSPDQIQSLVEYIVAVSHEHEKYAPVLLVEITPTPSRFAAWDQIRKANERLREIALTTPNTYFVPTAGQYLRPSGTPRDKLFVDDKLHLNEEGYDLWGSLIRRRLDEVLAMGQE